MNPEVKKIFVLFNELIQNQSDNILLPPCLKLPNSNPRVFLRNKLANRKPSKYQYILAFEDLLKLKETDIVDSCDKVIGHCANHSGSPGFEVYLNKTMLFSVWTYQELADALSIFEDNVKKRLKVVCGELTIKAIYVLEKKWRYYIERKNSLTENEPMPAGDEDDSFRDVLSNIKLGESVKIWDIQKGIFIGCFSPGLVSKLL